MLLNEETRSQLQLEKVLEKVHPRSAPGRAFWSSFVPSLPGDEPVLEAAFVRSDWLLAQEGGLPLLEGALEGIQEVGVLTEPPSTWGDVELASVHSLLEQLVRVFGWLKERGALHWKVDFDPSDALRLLAPHTGRGGFELVPRGGAAREAAIALEAAHSVFTSRERACREESARALGVSPARLRTDIVVDDGMGELERQLQKSERFVLVDSTAWQRKYRYVAPLEVLDLRGAQERARQALEVHLSQARRLLIDELVGALKGIEAALETVGILDVDLARARYGKAIGGIRPLLGSKEIAFCQAANPVLSEEVAARGGRLQRVSCNLNRQVVTLFGSNMGGKSSFLRTVGLLQAMAQYGLYLPVESWCGGLFDRIGWCGSGEDASLKGLSSFGREITMLTQELAQPGRILLLVDEFGRSTSFEEGRALAEGLVRYFMGEKEGVMVMAGHVKSLAKMAGTQAYTTGGFDPTLLPREGGLGGSVPPEDGGAGSRQDAVERISQAMDYAVHPYHEKTTSDAYAIARLLSLPFEIGEGGGDPPSFL